MVSQAENRPNFRGVFLPNFRLADKWMRSDFARIDGVHAIITDCNNRMKNRLT